MHKVSLRALMSGRRQQSNGDFERWRDLVFDSEGTVVVGSVALCAKA